MTFLPFVRSFRSGLVAFGAVGALTSVAAADLTLTADGISRGFQLTTFSYNMASAGVGPEGVAYAPDGTVLVAEYPNGRLQRFLNIDNQDASTVPYLATYGTDQANGLAYLGSTAYMSQYANGRVLELNADGTMNRVVTTGLGAALGLAANPHTGRLFVGYGSGVVDLDPVTGSFTSLVSGSSVDGITLSPDGATLYAAVRGGINSQHLIGYNTSTGAVVYDSGALAGGIDGTVLGFGPFEGYVYANMNNGTLIELNLNSPGSAPVIIASGGTRGDMAAFDPTRSGDMLITQLDRIIRLSGVPAPSSLVPLALGGFIASRRRRR